MYFNTFLLSITNKLSIHGIFKESFYFSRLSQKGTTEKIEFQIVEV